MIRRVSLGILSVFIILAIGFIIFVLLTKPQYKEPDIRNWRTGDVFFSVGDSWESYVVRSLTSFRERNLVDSTPSHCGIILIEKTGPVLVHASTVAKKVVKETPEEYIRKNGSFMIYSHAIPYDIDTILLRKNIDELLEKDYPFDFDFNHRDQSSLYCSELVLYLLELNGIDQLSDLRELAYIYPQDILNRLNDLFR